MGDNNISISFCQLTVLIQRSVIATPMIVYPCANYSICNCIGCYNVSDIAAAVVVSTLIECLLAINLIIIIIAVLTLLEKKSKTR